MPRKSWLYQQPQQPEAVTRIMGSGGLDARSVPEPLFEATTEPWRRFRADFLVALARCGDDRVRVTATQPLVAP